MKNIIVPTDFSAVSINAAHYALDMALSINADLLLLHVQPLPLLVADVPIPFANDPSPFAYAEEALEQLKQDLEKRCSKMVSITSQLSTGYFPDELKNLNRRKTPFAVIMGSRGRGNTEAFFMGSFARTAIAELKAPILIVPPETVFQSIKKIGLACDMQNVSETMPFQTIRDIFEVFDAQLVVLYIAKPGEDKYPEVLVQTKFIQNSLAKLQPELGINTHENIKEGLEAFVNKSGIDLLLLLHKERNFMESFFHKSTAKQMLVRPKVPVMILHE